MVARIARSRWFLTATAAIVTAVLLIAQDASSPCRKVSAANGTLPSDYCYFVPVSARNDSGGTLTNQAFRVGFNASGLVSATQLDNEGWDLHPTYSGFSNESDVLAGDMSSASAAWWFQVPSIANGATATVNLYFGASDVQRDQGMALTGSDSAAIAHHADFNITDNLTLNTRLEVLDTAVAGQNSTIASHWSANQGYRLLFISSGGLKIRGQIDGHAGCDVGPLTTSDDSINLQVNMTFTNPNVTVQVVNDAGTVLYTNTCNTGMASISTVSTDFTMGNSATQVILRDVRLLSGSTVMAHYGFNPKAMAETSWVDPVATGTVTDESGRSHTATYTFSRAMTGRWAAASVGSVQLVSSSTAPTLPDTDVDIVGTNQFGLNLSVTPTPITTDMFYSLFSASVTATTASRTLAWTVFFVSLALGMLLLGFLMFRYIPMAIFLAGVPLVFGTVRGFLPPYVIFVWALLAIGSWLAVRQGEAR